MSLFNIKDPSHDHEKHRVDVSDSEIFSKTNTYPPPLRGLQGCQSLKQSLSITDIAVYLSNYIGLLPKRTDVHIATARLGLIFICIEGPFSLQILSHGLYTEKNAPS